MTPFNLKEQSFLLINLLSIQKKPKESLAALVNITKESTSLQFPFTLNKTPSHKLRQPQSEHFLKNKKKPKMEDPILEHPKEQCSRNLSNKEGSNRKYFLPRISSTLKYLND